MAKGGKTYEGIQVCDLKISVFEMKRHYEVHFVYENEENVEGRMDTSIQYLGNEGFFKKAKRIKATAMKFNEKE
tara:strand:+ start:1518 stop:1739 length:222 start_codon:yes stop_codon:yes gene_type:complete